MRSLAEAVLIVLAVSLLSLGLRTGLVVALSIPLVLAVDVPLHAASVDIGLHKISLGALILSLGLLVDDAIIAVEMMAIKMEQGFDRLRAASFAYTSTAFPMLTGTLVTVAGFLPIATAERRHRRVHALDLPGDARSRCSCRGSSRWCSIPYLGYKLLPDLAEAAQQPSLRAAARARRRRRPRTPARRPRRSGREHAIYETPFYGRLRAS